MENGSHWTAPTASEAANFFSAVSASRKRPGLPAHEEARRSGDGAIDLPFDRRSAWGPIVGDRQPAPGRGFSLHRARPPGQRFVNGHCDCHFHKPLCHKRGAALPSHQLLQRREGANFNGALPQPRSWMPLPHVGRPRGWEHPALANAQAPYRQHPASRDRGPRRGCWRRTPRRPPLN